jgi:SanA protein
MAGKNIFRKIIFVTLFLFLGWTGFVVSLNKIVSLSTADLISDRENELPDYPYILVLGSGNTPDPASRNYSFSSRMDKASAIYRVKNPKKIIVSGLSNRLYYNEPNDMRTALMESGVPAEVIYPDHGGLRTFLSVKRMKEKFGAEPVIIISQRKQLERALYIARSLNITCAGLEAAPVPRMNNLSCDMYEMIARVKCQAECIFNR